MKIFTLLPLLATLATTATPVAAASLTDISSSRNRDAIQYLNDSGVIGGYPDGTFKPQNTVNRAELLKILVGGQGVTPTVDQYHDCFPDVGQEWFAPFVCYAKEQGWVGGYPDGTFRAANTVNKVEAIKMIVNSQGYVVPDSVAGKMYDDTDNNAWYAPFVKAAMDKGILEEIRGNLGVSADMKRGGAAESIYRAVIIREQGLTRFNAEEKAETIPSTNEYTHDVKRIEATTTIENTDADAENDSLKVSAYWYFVSKTDPTAPEEAGYPVNKDWTVKVSIYDRQSGGEKGKLLYEHTFPQSAVEYREDEYPYVLVPLEEIRDAGHLYGFVEVTFESPTRGKFSAIDDFATIRETTDESLAQENQVKDLNLQTISLSYFWTSWDADAENDGFKLNAYYKDEKGEQVYPNSMDWTITANIYDSESDYGKYKDFSQHRIGSPITITFKGKDVLYESLGTPYVHVPKEKITFPSVEHGRFIVEAEFRSPTYGVFSGQTEVPDWRNKQ